MKNRFDGTRGKLLLEWRAESRTYSMRSPRDLRAEASKLGSSPSRGTAPRGETRSGSGGSAMGTWSAGLRVESGAQGKQSASDSSSATSSSSAAAASTGSKSASSSISVDSSPHHPPQPSAGDRQKTASFAQPLSEPEDLTAPKTAQPTPQPIPQPTHQLTHKYRPTVTSTRASA